MDILHKITKNPYSFADEGNGYLNAAAKFAAAKGDGMETYFNAAELAAYLKVAEQSLRRWVLNNEIPYHRIHSVIRFRLSEIEKWVDSGGIYTRAESGTDENIPPCGKETAV
jgi:excisionase family DNA binding protein